MTRHFHRNRALVHLGLLLPATILIACSDAAPGGDGTEGGSGGAAESGGAAGSGGGSVGGTASGGAFGAGGVLASGGTAGSGGAAFNSGGAPASGGSDGVGGDEAGAGGETTGVGGMGETSFAPCPDSGPCKILPLGDSITVGWGSSNYGSYRTELFRLARSDGHEITYTGTKADGPAMVDGVAFPRSHEGVAGETISQISGRVDGALNQDTPHIVIVHAGTNDMNYSRDGAEGRLADLVDKLIAALPDALIVVGSIIPFPDHASDVSVFNASVEPMVQERAGAGAHVVFVDQFDGYQTGSELPDGVHPNDAGYARMAGKWYSAIESYLP